MGRESGRIPIISFLTHQEFLGELIGLVMNGGARLPFFWHAVWRARHFMGSNERPALQNAFQFMLTTTSLGALLLSMQYKSLMGI